MMAQFIVYAMGVSALVCLACHCFEIGLLAYGRPARAAWLGGLGVMTMMTVAAMFGIGPRFATPGRRAAHVVLRSANATVTRLSPSLSGVRPVAVSMFDRLQQLDNVVLGLWMLASAVALVTLVVLSLRARRLIENSRESSIQGVPVKLTSNSGPALAGFLHYVILLPEWCLRLPDLDQKLIIEHERAHANARDPLMVWMAAVAIAIFPWNAPLWYLMRRLRTSIELDCDARVLERVSDVHAYGSLLLTVGARAPRAAIMAPAFSEHASELQRRIRVMASRTRIANRGVVLFASISSVLLLGAAVRAPRPSAIAERLFAFNNSRPGDVTKLNTTKRNLAAVNVLPAIPGVSMVMVFPTGSAAVGLGLKSAAVRRDTLYMRAPGAFTADITGGDVHVVSMNGGPILVLAHFSHSPAGYATMSYRHVILVRGGVGIKGELSATERLNDIKGQVVNDTLAAMVRRSEPRAFQLAGSSVIGLVIDENNRVTYHSRLDVPDTTTNLDVLQRRLFPDMRVVEASPYRVMIRLTPQRTRGNVQAVAVFMKRPLYAPQPQ